MEALRQERSMSFPGSNVIERERARIRRFLGRDLPERTLELRFGILPPRRCKARPRRSENTMYAHLQAHRGTPVEYMGALLSLTRSINRCPMPERRRFAGIDALARWFYAATAPKLREMAAEGGGIPEHERWTAQLDQIDKALQALLYGYLDYVELSRARADRNRFAMPPRLARLEPVHQTSIGYLLHRNLRLPGLWGDVSSSRARHRDLRIYVGYDEVRAHLLAITGPRPASWSSTSSIWPATVSR
jgi:hypothetical protein